MRTTVVLDDDLVAKAQAISGVRKTSTFVHVPLKARIERESARRLAHMGGGEADVESPRTAGRRRHSTPVSAESAGLDFAGQWVNADSSGLDHNQSVGQPLHIRGNDRRY